MKLRESGMPEEGKWSTYFTPSEVLTRLELSPACGDAADFGCGYGTFAVPAAEIVSGVVHAFDIEAGMVQATSRRAEAVGATRLRAEQRDLVTQGTGLAAESVDYVLLFNLLHCEEPGVLFTEARRILREGGRLGIVHWNPDPSTPRGPPMAIRPRPEACRRWALEAGFSPSSPTAIDLPPYHYGLVFVKRGHGLET